MMSWFVKLANTVTLPRRLCPGTDARFQIGKFWDDMSRSSRPGRTRWWESNLIRRHVNRVVSGSESDGLIEVAKRKAAGRVFDKAVSVGCGNGAKEMALIRSGLVRSFDLFELSAVRIEAGIELATRLGLTGCVRFRSDNAFTSIPATSMDLVHWNNSLHHMLDVEEAVSWSLRVLRQGGMFYMDDFVGPNRFQWSDASCEFASRIRSLLPERYLRNPYHPDKQILLNRNVRRPDVKSMADADPSEAAQSELILDSVRRHFPDVEITRTGGLIYHLALNDVLHNFDEDDEYDRTLLELLLIVDQLCIDTPGLDCHYATAIAFKS